MGQVAIGQKRNFSKISMVLLCSASLTSVAQAQTTTSENIWTGAQSTDPEDAANWSQGNTPNSVDANGNSVLNPATNYLISTEQVFVINTAGGHDAVLDPAAIISSSANYYYNPQIRGLRIGDGATGAWTFDHSALTAQQAFNVRLQALPAISSTYGEGKILVGTRGGSGALNFDFGTRPDYAFSREAWLDGDVTFGDGADSSGTLNVIAETAVHSFTGNLRAHVVLREFGRVSVCNGLWCQWRYGYF